MLRFQPCPDDGIRSWDGDFDGIQCRSEAKLLNHPECQWDGLRGETRSVQLRGPRITWCLDRDHRSSRRGGILLRVASFGRDCVTPIVRTIAPGQTAVAIVDRGAVSRDRVAHVRRTRRRLGGDLADLATRGLVPAPGARPAVGVGVAIGIAGELDLGAGAVHVAQSLPSPTQ